MMREGAAGGGGKGGRLKHGQQWERAISLSPVLIFKHKWQGANSSVCKDKRNINQRHINQCQSNLQRRKGSQKLT